MCMLVVNPFRCITLFGLDNMLDIPQQNHLKYGFNAIKVNTYIKYISKNLNLKKIIIYMHTYKDKEECNYRCMYVCC